MSRNVVHGIRITTNISAFERGLIQAAEAAKAFTLAVFCDGEAAAVLWCRHHPEPVCGDYTRRVGREYRRRRRARARRRR